MTLLHVKQLLLMGQRNQGYAWTDVQFGCKNQEMQWPRRNSEIGVKEAVMGEGKRVEMTSNKRLSFGLYHQ
jgi:hypothetical protein